MTDEIKLTQYSRGAGCGCKIAPRQLQEILKSQIAFPANENLLVGNQSNDDAAVYKIDEETALISTTDFFTPIVDDPLDFGRIAAANAISDVYAMGGKPLLAIAILGWPIEKLPVAFAQKILEGGRTICIEAGIPLAGGHTIDTTEPIFGLAVTGYVQLNHLKKNNTAKAGDYIFLTKALGTGILSTAQKRGLLREEHEQPMKQQLSQLNKLGEKLGKVAGVTAMTDVTGFGLVGHLIEMAEGSNVYAEIEYNKLRLSPGVSDYIRQRIFPDATTRNWSSYSDKIKFNPGVNVMEAFTLLPDPQTNGGLLFGVNENALSEIQSLLVENGYAEYKDPVGRFVAEGEKLIVIK